MDLTLITAVLSIFAAVLFYVKGALSGKKSERLGSHQSVKEEILHEVVAKQKEITEKQKVIKQKEAEIAHVKQGLQAIVESKNEAVQKIMEDPKAKELLKEFYKW